MSIRRAFLRGGFWTILVTGIGLSPLWLKWFICMLSKQSYSWIDVVGEGIVMFFAMTLVGTIGVDLQLIEKERINLPREANVILYVIMPFCIFPCVAASFALLVTVPQSVNMKALGDVQVAAFVLAILYAFLVKSIQFWKETM